MLTGCFVSVNFQCFEVLVFRFRVSVFRFDVSWFSTVR